MNYGKVYLNNLEITNMIYWEMKPLENKLIFLILTFEFDSNFLDVYDTNQENTIKIEFQNYNISFLIKHTEFCGIRPNCNKICQIVELLAHMNK